MGKGYSLQYRVLLLYQVLDSDERMVFFKVICCAFYASVPEEVGHTLNATINYVKIVLLRSILH